VEHQPSSRKPQSKELDEIKVRSYVNGQLISFKCSSLHCKSPLDLGPVIYQENGASSSGSLLAALRAVVMDALSSGEGKTLAPYAHGLSKAAAAHLSDGIVPIDGNSVDLASVFREMDVGEFEVEFCPVARDGMSNCTGAGHQRWKWQPGSPARFQRAGSIGPGLYEIGAYTENQDGLAPVRESAMVLLVHPGDLENARERYVAATRETRDWDRSEQAIAHRVFFAVFEFVSEPVRRWNTSSYGLKIWCGGITKSHSSRNCLAGTS
jgi:hypothetical protein